MIVWNEIEIENVNDPHHSFLRLYRVNASSTVCIITTPQNAKPVIEVYIGKLNVSLCSCRLIIICFVILAEFAVVKT